MSPGRLARSEAAAAASRRNGALGCGPTSAEGKAASARNARKHGLFGTDALSGSLSPAFAAVRQHLGAELEQGSRAAWQAELATAAALRLDYANKLIRQADVDLTAALLGAPHPDLDPGTMIASLARLRRYTRRFRGQRDRALRKAMGSSRRSRPEDLVHGSP